MPAFVQSYSQSQARLMFLATLVMDNFDCIKMNAHFKQFTACLREGLIHECKQALLAPPPPLMSLNNSRICSTFQLSCLQQRATDDILRILVKAQSSTRSTGPQSPTMLGIRSQACPMSTVLATVAFLLLVDTSLLSQAGTTYYSQLLTLQHSTKLLFFFFKSI